MTMAPMVVKGQGAGRQQRRRDGRARLDDGAGCGDGQDRLARLQHRTRHGRADRVRDSSLLSGDRGKDLGVLTWPGDAWKIGGGGRMGLDLLRSRAQSDLLRHGKPGPWNPDLRPGDNKWTAAMFARDPDTGEAVWSYQWSPHDLFDYDGINEQILLDLPIGGRQPQGADSARAQRLHLRARSSYRRGALRRSLSASSRRARASISKPAG